MEGKNPGHSTGKNFQQAATKRPDAVVSARSWDLVDEKASRRQLLSSGYREDQEPVHEETDWARLPKVVQAGSEAGGLTMSQVEAQVSIQIPDGASDLTTLPRLLVMLAMRRSAAT